MPRDAGGASFREVRPGDRDVLIELDDAAMAPYGFRMIYFAKALPRRPVAESIV